MHAVRVVAIGHGPALPGRSVVSVACHAQGAANGNEDVVGADVLVCDSRDLSFGNSDFVGVAQGAAELSRDEECVLYTEQSLFFV